MKKLTIYFTVLFAALVAASCGIETIQPLIKLNTPLGVETVCSNNKIYISFWGLNNETYFSGYDLYVALDTEQYNNDKGFYYTNSEGVAGNPTIWQNIKPVSSATNILTWSTILRSERFAGRSRLFLLCEGLQFGILIHSDRSDYSKVKFVRN
jgi:hypothetical protein